MPRWLSNFFRARGVPDNVEDTPPSTGVLTEKDTRASNGTTVPASSTSTAVENQGLPPPVTQSNLASANNHRKKKVAKVGGLSFYWVQFRKRLGTGSSPSSSSLVGGSATESAYTRRVAEQYGEGYGEGIVDEIVVDRAWTEELHTSVTPHSECGVTPESQQPNPISSESASFIYDGFWSLCKPLAIIRWRTWPFLMKVFSSRFANEKAERHYAQENWFLKKSLALWTSLWFVCNWVLACVFIPNYTFFLLDKIFYFGVAPILSTFIVLMVMYDWPRDRPFIYQVFLILSVWCLPFHQVAFILSCGFYGPAPDCGGRDFLSAFYYTSALQTIALFGLKLNRLPAALGALAFFLFASITMIPMSHPWGRMMINFVIFQSFLIYLHYMRESSERRLYTLRDQLKIQFKATQKAQINERKAAESKRRLTSYVRVPLNTALLAVQNVEASGTIGKDQEIEFSALCGSLSMMSKVLNDVLDFNRMDIGKFESVSRPYVFHQVMRSLFVPLRMATDARGLTLETRLDRKIDIIARKVAYEALGETKDAIQNHTRNYPEVDGVVVGDETRLRQIITNLTSNACKFTPEGGKLIITTRLILPDVPDGTDPLDVETAMIPRIEKPAIHPDTSGDRGKDSEHGKWVPYPTDNQSYESVNDGHPDVLPEEGNDHQVKQPLSTDRLTEHNRRHATSALEYIVVRIEVTDTGFGIKPEDMAESKLFSAFNQTEQGRQQGGKGTGLGLALVRQIVKLSGGRLGVRSKTGEGSTFWVEMPLGVGVKAIHSGEKRDGSDTDTLHHFERPCQESGDRARDQHLEHNSVRFRSSRIPDAAMQGIMEQGGLFEIKLKKPSEQRNWRPSAKLPADPMDRAALEFSQAQIASPSQSPLQPPTHCRVLRHTTIGGVEELMPPHNDLHGVDGGESTTAKSSVQRTPYVGVLSSQAQAKTDVTASSSSPSSIDKSSVDLKKFDDNSTRGSPSMSFTALNIEHGLPVLVVDDDLVTRTLMKRLLTRLGCHVRCAENGEVALQMILGHPFVRSNSTEDETLPLHLAPNQYNHDEIYAVVFLDNQMPVMSGLKVIGKLREMKREDFVVGVTGNALLSDQEEYYAAGVDRILTKPVMERNLRDILVEADERRKARQASKPGVPLA